MLVFIAVLSGVVAGVAAGSLTPLLILRVREQRIGSPESASVPDDETSRPVGTTEATRDPWTPPDPASTPEATPAEHGVPDLEPPLPDPDGPLPPPSWARAAPPEPDETPAPPSHEAPDERATEPFDTDLWEGWGSQGSLDELWRLEEARPPVSEALLRRARRAGDTVLETARRARRLAEDRFPEDAASRLRSALRGAFDGVRVRVRRLDRDHLALAGIVAVAAVTAVVLGILASRPSDEVAHVTVDREAQPPAEPYLIEVDVPATPAPAPESRTSTSGAAAPSAAEPASTSGPDVSADASCGAEGIHVDFSLSSSGADLRWFTLYVDGSPVTGGPLDGGEYSGSYNGTGEPGGHDVELVGTDEAGTRSVDRAQVDCPAPA